MKTPPLLFLIDDDPDDQEIFVMVLREINMDIRCELANDGVDGIVKLNSWHQIPDFIFIDINMPKMNGIDCLTIIRSDDRFKDSKVIMYSTTAESKMVFLTKKLGADDFIMKATSMQVLKNQLINILK